MHQDQNFNLRQDEALILYNFAARVTRNCNFFKIEKKLVNPKLSAAHVIKFS